jgi:hypothetical protein
MAFGYNGEAPNADEATFGNLNGEELDLNVTGDATVHGQNGLEIRDPSSTGPGSLDELSDNSLAVNSQGGRLRLQSSSSSAVRAESDLEVYQSNITAPVRGNVTLGDSLKVYGDVWASGADLAEIYSSHQKLEKGELVMLSGRKEVQRTVNSSSDPVGVVSTSPGTVLNSDEQGRPVALEGKVPVKVDGGVERGELLVPSDKPGVATSCEASNAGSDLNAGSSSREILEAVRRMEERMDCLERSIGRAMESGSGKVTVKLD